MRFLLIDACNLGIRSSFVHKDLSIDLVDYSQDLDPDKIGSTRGGFPTGALHGFLRNIAAVRREYPDRYVIVVWDGKSKARIEESRVAVEKGIVPAGYKENRPDSARPPAVISFYQQRPVLMEALSLTNVPQIVKQDEEADDVIASFVSTHRSDDIMVMTSDKDYYQLFGDGIRILSSGGGLLSEAWFRRAYGISPAQWVDVGALMGDDGDNIFGVPWWGEGTAVKQIAKHGSCETVLSVTESEFGVLREKYPDIHGDDLAELRALKTANDIVKYPHVKDWMPYTGVALAYERGILKKITRSAVTLLVYQSRVPLAKNLKAMRRTIKLPNLPVDLGRDKMIEFDTLCNKYGLREVAAASHVICGRQALS